MKGGAIFCGLVWGISLCGFGCQGEADSTSAPTPCRGNSDCAANQTCSSTIQPGSGSQAIAAPPCLGMAACTTSAQCGTNVCAPNPYLAQFPGFQCPPMVCTPPCQSTGCATDQRCEASGLCATRLCSEADAPACAEHYRCDTAAAAMQDGAPLQGSNIADTDDPRRAATRGCVRKKCSEAGGFTCGDNWRCDPSKATDPSGCVPLPCSQTGHCTNDGSSICMPTSAGPRPPGMDAHGCVSRNCGEGMTSLCTYIQNGVDYGYCDVTAPTADINGCMKHRCNERAGACVTGYKCDPTSPNADPLGCRAASCREGTTCQPSFLCDPGSPYSDVFGCRTPETLGTGGTRATGGTGGTRATGGTPNSGNGGAGGGISGTGGDSNAMGICVTITPP
jgi:hypothetical protein